MVERVEEEMREHGPSSMLLGPLRGTPYKIYAWTAGLQEQPLGTVLLWTIPARGALRLDRSRLRPLGVVGSENHIPDGLAPRSVPTRLDSVLRGLLLDVRVLTAASALHATAEGMSRSLACDLTPAGVRMKAPSRANSDRSRVGS